MTPLDNEDSEDPREPKEATTREKLTKKASVVFERKVSDGNSFWSNSARNSVVSMFESGSGSAEQGETVASQNPRKILQKKRSSLSHQPDIERALEKKASQESVPVHEFQKVMSGLKRVEDQKYEMKKLSSTTNLDPCQTGGKETSEETLGCKNLDRNGKGSIKRERNSSDTKASDLNSKLKEDKSSSALKKKQMNKTGGKSLTQSKPTPPKKQTLKPQHSAPARTSSLKTKKEGSPSQSSENQAVKSSSPGQKKVKPDTIGAHKNPTRSRSSSPKANGEKQPSTKVTGAGSVTRTKSLRSKPSQTKMESTASLGRTPSFKKQDSKPEMKQSKSVSKTPSKPSVKSDRKQKVEERVTVPVSADTPATPKKVPPPVPPKPNSQPARKNLTSSSETKKVPPPVAAKPGQRRFNLARQNDNASNNSKDVVKKMVPKTSMAELARLADSQALEIVVKETLHQTQFVSHAKATLSPVPSRKIRSNTANLEDSDAENTVEQDEEPGIISESVSASSVIQMFGGVGRFKKTGSCSTSPSSEAAPSPVEDKTRGPPARKSSSEKTVRKSSEGVRSAAPRKKSSSTSAPTEPTAVNKKRSVPRKESKKGEARAPEQSKSNSVVKTSMTVRLQSGNVRKLSDKDQKVTRDKEEKIEKKKVSLKSNPKKVDIKPITGDQSDVLEKKEEDAVEEKEKEIENEKVEEVVDEKETEIEEDREEVVLEMNDEEQLDEKEEEPLEEKVEELLEEKVEEVVKESEEEEVVVEEEEDVVEEEEDYGEEMQELEESPDDDPVKGVESQAISGSALSLCTGPDKSRQ